MKNRKWDIFFSAIAVVLVVIMIFDMLPHKKKKVIQADTVTEIQTETETMESASETDRETEKETESITETETEKETESITETEQETETESESEYDTESETEPQSETETISSTMTDKYIVIIEKTNSWESDGKVYTQCVCKVVNSSDNALNGWSFSKKIGNGYEIVNGWNGVMEIKDGTLYISPVEWNGMIPPKSTVETCGFIISGPKEFGNQNSEGEITTKPSDTAETTAANNEKPYIPPTLEDGTPLANHGKLSLNGTDLVDKNGNKYQLKGPSTHGLQWYPQYVEKETFQFIRDNWGANMIRLAMYTAENGYCSGNAANMEAMVDKGVNACTELGMYVIIDWHILSDGNPNTNKESAKEFFAKMAKRYSSYDNVLFEICNEPNGVSWSEVKAYADEIIPIIRQYHKDAIIICGTPTWSQDVDQVAANPLKKENQRNVMYALHFYAATHGQFLRDKAEQAIKAGTPVFVSEFSICDASGNGGIDYNSAGEWKALINKYNLSYAGWSLSNKAETSALIKNGVSSITGWSTDELSDTGKWLRQMISE